MQGYTELPLQSGEGTQESVADTFAEQGGLFPRTHPRHARRRYLVALVVCSSLLAIAVTRGGTRKPQQFAGDVKDVTREIIITPGSINAGLQAAIAAKKHLAILLETGGEAAKTKIKGLVDNWLDRDKVENDPTCNRDGYYFIQVGGCSETSDWAGRFFAKVQHFTGRAKQICGVRIGLADSSCHFKNEVKPACPDRNYAGKGKVWDKFYASINDKSALEDGISLHEILEIAKSMGYGINPGSICIRVVGHMKEFSMEVESLKALTKNTTTNSTTTTKATPMITTTTANVPTCASKGFCPKGYVVKNLHSTDVSIRNCCQAAECSVKDSSGMSATYPCECGTSTCHEGEACSKSSNSCQALKSCASSYSCPERYKRREGKDLFNPSMEPRLITEKCCQETCARYDCPTGYVAVKNRADSTTFTQDNCCQETCARYDCPTGYVAVKYRAYSTTFTQDNCCQDDSKHAEKKGDKKENKEDDGKKESLSAS